MLEDEPKAKLEKSPKGVHDIPLNEAAASDPRSFAILPTKSTPTNKNSMLTSQIQDDMSKEVSYRLEAKQPSEFKARLLGVDQWGWFYVREVTEQNVRFQNVNWRVTLYGYAYIETRKVVSEDNKFWARSLHL